MSKKVQVSTVRQTADVEVIFINANLISKVIKSHIILDSLISEAKHCRAIETVEVPMTDADGNPILDENGCVKVDEKETTLKYHPCDLWDSQLKDLNETVLPFLKELVEAFDA